MLPVHHPVVHPGVQLLHGAIGAAPGVPDHHVEQGSRGGQVNPGRRAQGRCGQRGRRERRIDHQRKFKRLQQLWSTRVWLEESAVGSRHCICTPQQQPLRNSQALLQTLPDARASTGPKGRRPFSALGCGWQT